MRQTKVMKLRSTNRGIAGTYENIEHHAKGVEALVRALEPLAPDWGFKTWRQGHNVHQFDTHDGKMYTLRPVWENDVEEQAKRGYYGLALSLRVSRSQEYVLTHITRLADVSRIDKMMKMLAKPQNGFVGGGLEDN